MTQDPTARAARLHTALQEVCGAADLTEAKGLLRLCMTMRQIPEARQSIQALNVLIEEWPSAEAPAPEEAQ